MRIDENDEKRAGSLRRIKRNCLLCMARQNLDPRERERGIVLDELHNLRDGYEELYHSTRKKNKGADEITLALDYKRAVMDALDICDKCPKDFERVSRFLAGY